VPPQLHLERAILLHQVGRHYEANKSFQQLRNELRQFDAIVTVPERLRWLLVDAQPGRRRVCAAQVVELGGATGLRGRAQIADLQNAKVPFIEQDFGLRRMPAGMRFSCTISFGPQGPFAKAATSFE
jgi:hypothetical protein